TDAYEKASVDLSSYGDTVQARFRSVKSTAFNGDMAIDDVAFDNAPLCPEVSLVNINGVTSSSVFFGFNSANSSFNFEIGPTGFTQGTGTVSSGGNPGTVSGLMPNTTYDLYIQTDCSGAGNGTSIWIGPFTFTTLCAPLVAPYLEDFESFTVGFFDGIENCVAIDSDNPSTTPSGGYSWEVRNTAQTTSGTGTGPDRDNTLAPAIGGHFVTADVSGSAVGNETRLLTPLIDITGLTSPELEYYYHMHGTGMADLHVDIWDGSAWINDAHLITGTQNTSQSDPYNDTTLDLSTYNIDTIQVRFRLSSNGCCSGDVAIDDIRISDPPTCPDPSNLGAFDVLATTASIYWTSGGASHAIVEYGPVGFALGTGTKITTTNDTLNITGLSGATAYEFYVQDSCGAGDLSFQSGPFRFITACTVVGAPYTWDFESSTVGHWDGTDVCWDYASNNPGTTSSGGYSWEVRNTPQTTSGTGTGPDRDNTLAPATGGNFVTADVSGSSANTDSTLLMSPEIDVTSLNVPELKFYYHKWGTNMPDLHVDVYDGTWHRDYLVITGVTQTSQSDPYTEATADLSSLGDTVQVRFRIISLGCCQGDIAIDDFSIAEGPTCPKPTGFALTATTSSSATLGWNTSGNAQSYIIEYGPAGFTQGQGTITSSTTNSVTISGLTQNNVARDAYLRAFCGIGDSSIWVGPITFFPTPVPCDDIEAYNTGLIQGQSALFLGWGGAAGDAEVSTTQAVSGTQSLRIYDSGPTGASDVVAYFDTIDSGAWEVAFKMYIPAGFAGYYNIQQNHNVTNPVGPVNLWGGEVYFQANGTAEVQYSTGSVVAGTFTYTQGQWNDISTVIDLANDTIWYEYNGSSTGVGYQYSIANPGGPLQFNGVNFFSGVIAGSTDQADFYVDDFCITPYSANNCPAPTFLSATNITCTSADLAWTSIAGKQSLVEYGPAGFTLGTGTKLNYVTSPASVSSLLGNTAYDFYVADTCGADTSAWVKSSFTTANAPISASFTAAPGAPGPTSLTVSFDGSASIGANSYAWNFGDGSSGSGMNTTHDYTANGKYQVTLTVTGPCGTASFSDSVTIAGISIEENIISRSLAIYPNPSSGMVNISFDTESSDDVTLTVLDLSGKVVRMIKSSNVNGRYDDKLDISELARGSYLLKVESGDIRAIRRIVRE
ncbi:MAG: PKD domain-containing protein, partial [Owenweeksia sp.]